MKLDQQHSCLLKVYFLMDMKKLLLLITTSMFVLNCAAQTLRVVTEDLPPYQIVVDNKLVAGRSFLLVDELLKRAKINARIEVLPWARTYSIASSEPNVMIFSMARTTSREANFHWLFKLDSLSYSFYRLATRPDLHIQSLEEALQHSVVSVRNSYEADSLLKMGFVEGKNLILSVSSNEAWQMVLLERADFIYEDIVIQNAISRTHAGKPVIFSKSYSPGKSSDLYLAANINTDADILHELRSNLLSMQLDGTAEQILSQRD